MTLNDAGHKASELSSEVRALRGEVRLLRNEVADLRRGGLDTRGLERRLYGSIEALLGMYRELDGAPSFPPFGGWAIAPDLARSIIDLVVRFEPNTVYELGSGVSTLLIGTLLKRRGKGRLVSLEHDPVWYAATLEDIDRKGLSEVVDLRYAPLVPSVIGERTYDWYDPEALHGSEDAEMVLVDGPPASTGELARYPAGPLFLAKAKPGCIAVVDDMIRQDEQSIVERWMRELDIGILERLAVSKGAVILQKNPGELSIDV